MKRIVASMVLPGLPAINFQAGSSDQIVKGLISYDNSIDNKGDKYPLIAMVLPVTETRGKQAVYYADVFIQRIIFAQIVSFDGTEFVDERYSLTGSFKRVLYPCYYEFLTRLAYDLQIVGSDPEMFEHEKIDYPGVKAISENSTDYIDSMEIRNLKFKLSQIKTC